MKTKTFNLRGKDVAISEKCLYAYEKYTMEKTTEESLVSILWAWCHKSDMNDVIAKMNPEDIADVIEESMREEFIVVHGSKEAWDELCKEYENK